MFRYSDLQDLVEGLNATVAKDTPNKFVAVKHCNYGDSKPKYWLSVTGKNDRVGLGRETYDISHSSYDPADAVSELSFDLARGRTDEYLKLLNTRKK